MKSILKIAAVIALTIVFTISGYVYIQHKANDYAKDLQITTFLNEPKAIEPFNLTDTKGQPFTEKSLTGHWSLLFFGFTRCPAICPTTMAALNQVYTQLKDEPKPQVWFISIDPARDNKKRIRRYVNGFNSDFFGATGSKKELDALMKQMNVISMQIKGNDKSAGDYSIDHSASIMLINPEGKLQAVIGTPPEADKILNDYRVITSHNSKP